MSEGIFDPEKKRQEFDKFIVKEYLRLGSIDEVFRVHGYNLPISYAEAHRLVKRWGIIKAAGPNARLSEVLGFLTVLSQEKIPLERLYRQMPLSFKTSISTLHRVLTFVRKETIRRVGTALVISPEDDGNQILVGRDISTPRPELGKPYGSLSLPMGYSSRTESAKTSILRVLQQEVFSQNAISQNMPNVIPDYPKPFMYFDIVDVRVAVYHVILPKELSQWEKFSSYKVAGHSFVSAYDLSQGNLQGLRMGIAEIGSGYVNYRRNLEVGPLRIPVIEKSHLNRDLALEYSYL